MTLPATDGILEKLQALLAYDASSPLIFSSGLFLFLFAGFMLIYNAFRRAPMARIVYVILFSLYFYYKSSGIYFLLLIFAATSDFLIAQGIYRVRNRAAKRWLVVLSVMVNLGMLGYFKYTNFLVDIANQMFGQGFLQFQNIFLPVGISFFVFQSMSYTIDIYRGQLKPLGNWCDYLFYLSFFPQLVAGPIVRARDFIPQIRRNPVVVTREMFGTGVFLILTGLFKKAIISDYISLNFVDRIFDEPLLYSGFECLAGIYGYALQIYCDFSGYSDMAIGIALLLGFRFPKNFDAPYKSATITEFWRRWHISLSTWLRDYLYISLGGNRKGKLRTYGNLPLIEPLESRESKKIEELALVIDTSYSTSGELVRAFLAETYTLLKGRENFFHRMNLHLIQADNAIRQDILIHNEDELIHAMNHFELRGGGGTDFRPAFAKIEELRRDGTLRDLQGVLYFTDGKGTYPTRRPPYETAFLFLETGTPPPDTPPWAMRLVLSPEEFLPDPVPKTPEIDWQENEAEDLPEL